MKQIPRSHPRYMSLKTREQLAQALKNGLVHETGLIAHGRGEAFDYLMGEQTLPVGDEAAKVAAAALLVAEKPVLSVNGNVAALVPRECVRLAEVIPAKLEVNLFHRTNERIERIIRELKKHGAEKVYGRTADARIPGLDHERARCDNDGIFSADVVLVPLEDGDRCQALRAMGKTVVVVDLNPLSRSAQTASVSIVDNVQRALPNIEKWVTTLKKKKREELEGLVQSWENEKMLRAVLSFLSKRLNSF